LKNECRIEDEQILPDQLVSTDLIEDDIHSDHCDTSDLDTDSGDNVTGDLELIDSHIDTEDAVIENDADEVVHDQCGINENIDSDGTINGVSDNAINDPLDIGSGDESDTLCPAKPDHSELEERCNQLELKVMMFEEMFADLKREISTGVTENGTLINSLSNELSTRADDAELKHLKSDFEHFSKRLKRVVKSEDSINAETLDAKKVPPDVLEITYAKTLNDLYSAITDIFGGDESSDIVENIRDQVRQFSAGVDFFIFEEGSFRIQGLSTAINSKLVSVKQIHGTYVELFKLLHQYVPNYDSQDFRSFVETGSREYAVEKVVAHEMVIEDILSEHKGISQEVSNLTENMQFIAELQNNQLDDHKITQDSVLEISEQIKDITKAINLHTRAIKKLNEDLMRINSSPIREASSPIPELNIDLSELEGSVHSKADRDELIAISNALNVFREEMNDTVESISHGMEQSQSHCEVINSIQNEIQQLREEMTGGRNNDPIMALELETEKISSQSQDIESMIIQELSELGSATFKQIEKQVKSKDNISSFDELSLIVDQMTQKNVLSSFKKGRYVYFSLTE